MKTESQRIAIAEACGAKWKEDNFKNKILVDERKDSVLYIDVHGGIDAGLPDYLNDLNAMHEAEKVLTVTQYDDFAVRLNRICDESRVLSATAAQRVQAFLMTLGLWKGPAANDGW